MVAETGFTNHGGKRPGAGRKALPVDQRRVVVTHRVLPVTAAKLKRYGSGAGKAIDRAMKREPEPPEPAS